MIQSLAYTIGADEALIARFEAFRKKRNIAGYERAGSASEQEAQEMLILARSLRKRVIDWLRETHPELI